MLTHDVGTMLRYGYERIKAGLPMPGIVIVNRATPLAIAIEEIMLLATCSHEGEWEGQILRLPLK